MKANFIPIVAVAVLMLALLGSFSGHAPAPAPPDERSATAPPDEDNVKDSAERRPPQSLCPALCQLSELLGIDASPDTAQAMDHIEAELKRRDMRPIRTLIALVSDPVDSHFRHLFDQEVEAIRAALDGLAFVPDRFFDPWHLDNRKGHARSRLHRELPGALVFHRHLHDGHDALLVVFLVGETPTAGVQQRALSSALELAYTLEQRRFVALHTPTLPQPTIQLLGPSLPGAALSLAVGVSNWARQYGRRDKAVPLKGAAEVPAKLEIISGLATSLTTRQRLEHELNAQLTKDAGNRPPPLTASFHATVPTDYELSRVAINFLERQLGARPEEIVMLAEATTSYSREMLNAIDDSSEELEQGYVIDRVRLRRAYFPPHISQLRSATDTTLAHLVAQPPLEEGSQPIDELATASPLVRSSAELALANILHTVATSGTHYATILASDSLDTIFLAEEVHKFFPDVQLLLFSSDLLYLHDQLSDLWGALVVSSYPPFPWAQRAVFPFEGEHEVRSFPTDLAEGVFNATTLLIDDPLIGDAVDYSAPFVIARPTESIRPHPWLSVVGNGEFYPVHYADGCVSETGSGDGTGTIATSACEDAVQEVTMLSPQDARDAHEETARINAGMWQLPRAVGFDLLVLITSIVSIAFAVWFLMVPLLDMRRWRLLALFVPCRAKRPVNRAHVLLFFAITVLIHVALLALQCIELTAQHKIVALCAGVAVPECASQAHPLLRLLHPLLIISLSVLATSAVVSLFPREEGDRRTWVFCAGLLFSAMVTITVVACGGYEVWLARQGIGSPYNVTSLGRSLMFFLDRARNLGSGVSLLTFAVFVGLAWLLWVVGHLRKAEIMVTARLLERWMPSPTAGVATILHELGIADQVHALRRRIAAVLPSARSLGVLAVVIAVAAGTVRPSLRIPFEGRAVSLVCQVLFWAMLGCCLAVFVRLVTTWTELRTLTDQLAAHPLREAFARVPSDVFETFGERSGARLDSLWREQAALIANHFKRSQTLRQLLCEVVSDLRLDGDASQVLAAEAAVLGRFWRCRPLAAATQINLPLEESARLATTSAAELYAAALPDESHLWLRLWEDLIATRLAVFIAYVREHLFNYLTFITASMILIMLAGASYPFHGSRMLFLVLWIAMVAIVVGTITVLVQMNRDCIISRLTNTEPGKITWDRSFISALLVHGALPVIGLIAVRFPQVGRPLFAWADPLLKILSQ